MLSIENGSFRRKYGLNFDQLMVAVPADKYPPSSYES